MPSDIIKTITHYFFAGQHNVVSMFLLFIKHTEIKLYWLISYVPNKLFKQKYVYISNEEHISSKFYQ